jgi:hypothetical protein
MTLTKAHKTGLCVGLVRTGYRPDDFEGVIQTLSSRWCLVASLDSLDSDGYWIIRRDTILNARYTRIEAFRHRILLANGAISRLRLPRVIDITTTDSLMASLVKQRRYAIVYRDTETEWWSLHAAILRQERSDLLLHGFDGAGRFESRVRRYPIAQITCIRLGSRYLREYQSAVPYDFDMQTPVPAA